MKRRLSVILLTVASMTLGIGLSATAQRSDPCNTTSPPLPCVGGAVQGHSDGNAYGHGNGNAYGHGNGHGKGLGLGSGFENPNNHGLGIIDDNGNVVH